jgi:hypothetical protein
MSCDNFSGSMGNNDKGTLENQREKCFAQDIVQANKLKARWKISIYAIFTQMFMVFYMVFLYWHHSCHVGIQLGVKLCTP